MQGCLRKITSKKLLYKNKDLVVNLFYRYFNSSYISFLCSITTTHSRKKFMKWLQFEFAIACSKYWDCEAREQLKNGEGEKEERLGRGTALCAYPPLSALSIFFSSARCLFFAPHYLNAWNKLSFQFFPEKKS